MSVRVLVFAKFAELLGRESLDISVPAPATVADILERVRALAPAASLPPELLCAVNRIHVSPEASVNDGDEVALLPPLAGG